MGGTDERYRQGETYHVTTEEKFTKGVGVVGKVCCTVFETVCRGWEDREKRLYRQSCKKWRNEYHTEAVV